MLYAGIGNKNLVIPYYFQTSWIYKFLGLLDGGLIHLNYQNETLIFPFSTRETVGQLLDMVGAETGADCSLVHEGNIIVTRIPFPYM